MSDEETTGNANGNVEAGAVKTGEEVGGDNADKFRLDYKAGGRDFAFDYAFSRDDDGNITDLSDESKEQLRQLGGKSHFQTLHSKEQTAHQDTKQSYEAQLRQRDDNLNKYRAKFEAQAPMLEFLEKNPTVRDTIEKTYSGQIGESDYDPVAVERESLELEKARFHWDNEVLPEVRQRQEDQLRAEFADITDDDVAQVMGEVKQNSAQYEPLIQPVPGTGLPNFTGHDVNAVLGRTYSAASMAYKCMIAEGRVRNPALVEAEKREIELKEKLKQSNERVTARSPTAGTKGGTTASGKTKAENRMPADPGAFTRAMIEKGALDHIPQLSHLKKR